MSSSRNPSCQLMYAEGSEWRALGKGDSLSLFPGILILRSDKKKKSSVTPTGSGDGWPCRRCVSGTQPAPTNGPAWGGGAASLGGLHGTASPQGQRAVLGCPCWALVQEGEGTVLEGMWLELGQGRCSSGSEHTQRDPRGSRVLQDLAPELVSTLPSGLLNSPAARCSSTLPGVAQLSIFIAPCVLMERQSWATRWNISRASCCARGGGKLSQELVLGTSSSGTYRGGKCFVLGVFFFLAVAFLQRDDAHL